MKEFIVAIELGSTKITGIAGQKNLDGSFSILAVAKEDASQCIRKGVVYNIDKTVMSIQNIVKKLETSLKTKIACVYVGVGGQSLQSIKNVVPRDLDEPTQITYNMIDQLRDTNRSMDYPDREILNAAVQEYKVDNQLNIDPVGIPCKRLEGNFLNIVWRKSFYRNLNRCFELAGVKIAEMRISLLMLANNVLTENEKRTGCVLVDLGAETTSVAVFYRNILRHLVVLPIGGNNITKDIASFQLDESDAEQLKLKYGNAQVTETAYNPTEVIPLDAERKVEMSTFNNVVEARVEEIVTNVAHQIPIEYTNNLLGGIILTGGGANLKNIEHVFRSITNIKKVRTANFILQEINTLDPDIKAHNGRYNTVLSLLVSGEINCAGEDIRNDLFADENADDTAGTEMPKGTVDDFTKVPTPDQKEQEDEERRRRQEELEREAEEQRQAERAERKKNSWGNRAWRSMKSFLGSLVEPED